MFLYGTALQSRCFAPLSRLKSALQSLKQSPFVAARNRSLSVLRRALIAGIGLPFLFLASPAECATRNVSGAAGCSDTTGTPYCTVNAAILAAATGDTIQIAAGTYGGAIASFSKSLTFVGAGSSTAGTVITKAITFTGAGPLTFSNLRVSGGGTNFKVSGTGNFSGLTLSGAAFVGNGGGAHGVYIKRSGTVTNVTVTNCSFTGHGQSGMLIEPGTGTSTAVDQVTVSGSTFDSNGEYGLRIDPLVTNLQVSTSNITNNAIDGLLLLYANGATLQNLTITGNRNGILLIPLTSSQSISNLTLTNVNASNNTRFISGHYGSGLTLTGDTGAITGVTVTGSTFSGNGIHGVDVTGAVSQVSIDCSIIASNVQQGIHEASNPSAQLTATHVYWGCPTGPNTTGCSTVTGNVNFVPFRASPTAACTTSVDLAVSETASANPVDPGGSLTYTITDTNNGPDPASGVVLTDSLPPEATFVTFSSGCALSGTTVTCTIGDLAAGAQAVNTITVTAPSSPGTITNGVTIQGNEADPNTANNSASLSTTVQSTVTVISIAVTPASASLAAGQTVHLTAIATYSDNSTKPATAQATWTSSSSAVATVNSGLVTAIGAGSVTITASLTGVSGFATISVGPAQQVPPDPATVASQIDPTVVTTVFESTKFLYSGSNPIQTGVAIGTIEKARACVLRGSVHDRGGASLAGATITILGHPELGGTESRLDGRFDLVVNGGGPLTVVYQKSGFIDGQRQVAAAWNQFVTAPDIVLIPYDTSSTAIASNSAQYQVARGSVVSDTRGTRRATMLFAPGTAASMILTDGSFSPLATMTVRASEYTIGTSGPAAMPANLPAQTGYTYCVELSADEAIAAGATSVSFSTPVAFYLENFLDFPVGTNVPVGFYDRARGVWVDQANGSVVQIVTIAGGRAYLDVTGDGLADDSDALIGTTPAERDRLATLYSPGQKLWRAALSHFTPIDCNTAAWFTNANSGVGAVLPSVDPPASATPAEDCGTACGSIIDVEDQVLREPIPVQGTPFSLMYSTRTAPGFTPGQDIEINAIKGTVPGSLKDITVDVQVAGQRATYTLAALPNQDVKFHWDGRDTYGRAVQGPAIATVSVLYRYPTVYWSDPGLRSIFADFYGTGPSAQGLIAQDRVVAMNSTLALGHLDSRGSDVAGWNLDIHHVYDPVSQTLYQGDGTVRAAKVIGPVVQTVAGGGTGNDNLAVNLVLNHPFAIAAAPDGSTYVSDQRTGHQEFDIYRIKPDGTYETVANGCCGTSDGLASQTRLRPVSMSVDPNGILYMLDSGSSVKVRKLSGGQVSTIAGGGNTEVTDDPGSGTSARLNSGKLTIGTDGAVYLSDSQGASRISPSGLVRHLAGNSNVSGTTGDGGSSRLASFQRASGVALAPSGSLYITDQTSVRRIAPNGIIEALAPADNANDSGFNSSSIVVDAAENTYVNTRHTIMMYTMQGTARRFAGGGTVTGENVPATAAALGVVSDLSMGADGAIYFLDGNRVKRVTAPLPGLGTVAMLVASEDGSQVYAFDENGRHLRTVDAETGVVIHLFGYDTSGRLVSVTDPDGNVTTIQRAPDGTPMAVVAPGGQQTMLNIGADGYLSRATNVAGEATALTYDTGGLLKTLTDPRSGLHQLSYSTDGRLIKDQDPAGGFVGLTRAGTETSYTVTQTTAEGRSMTYQYATAPDGAVARSTTDSAGLTSTSSRTAARIGTIHSSDGSTATSTDTPDPRFGAQALLSSGTFRTPNLLSALSFDRAATLSDPRDPLSVTTLTEHRRVNGRTYTRAFTALNRQTTFTTPEARTLNVVRNVKDHVISATASGFAAIGFSYDSRGLMTVAQTGSRQTLFTYDAQRRLRSVTDPLQRSISLDYDPADRVTIQTLYDGRQVHFSYDQSGNITSVTPPSRPPHSFSYTAVNLNSLYAPPSVPFGGSTQYTYNHDKQLTLITRPDSRVIQIHYDAAGRLGTLTLSRGVYRYAYDNSAGKLTSITAPNDDIIQFTYDGSLLTDTTLAGVVTGSIHWDYDSDLAINAETVNCLTATTVACQPASFSYDSDKLLIGVGDLSLTRDAQSGLLTGASIGALTDAWTYNSFGEPLTHTTSNGAANLLTEQFIRDDVGRITERDETVAGTSTTSNYGYDAASRLATVTTNATATATYVYDLNGNRASKTTLSGIETGSYDDQDRVTSYGTATFVLTQNGDRQSKTDTSGTTAYTYDELGNLMTVTLPDGRLIEYTIDAKNRRIAKKVDGVIVQRLIYSDSLRPAAQIDSNGNVLARFIYGTRTNVPDLVVKDDITYRVVSDQLGSVRLIVNTADGAVAQRVDYDEFGNVLSDTNVGFQPFGFAGGLFDPDTQLVRFGARDYDPRTGRWTAKDPLLLATPSANVYQYCDGDPINWIDPNGLENRKPGKTPPSSWPTPHENVVGKKPKWNSDGYWEGKGGRQCTWDDRSHGAGVDRGKGPQGGHWDDENSDNRWDENGNLLGSGSSRSTITAGQVIGATLVAIGSLALTLLSGGTLEFAPANVVIVPGSPGTVDSDGHLRPLPYL